MDAKPLTGEDADQFAKREVRAQIGRTGAQQITEAALANAKFEGDYGRVMALPTPGAAEPGPCCGRRTAGGGRGAAGGRRAAQQAPRRRPKSPLRNSQKEQPKN